MMPNPQVNQGIQSHISAVARLSPSGDADKTIGQVFSEDVHEAHKKSSRRVDTLLSYRGDEDLMTRAKKAVGRIGKTFEQSKDYRHQTYGYYVLALAKGDLEKAVSLRKELTEFAAGDDAVADAYEHSVTGLAQRLVYGRQTVEGGEVALQLIAALKDPICARATRDTLNGQWPKFLRGEVNVLRADDSELRNALMETRKEDLEQGEGHPRQRYEAALHGMLRAGEWPVVDHVRPNAEDRAVYWIAQAAHGRPLAAGFDTSLTMNDRHFHSAVAEQLEAKLAAIVAGRTTRADGDMAELFTKAGPILQQAFLARQRGTQPLDVFKESMTAALLSDDSAVHDVVGAIYDHALKGKEVLEASFERSFTAAVKTISDSDPKKVLDILETFPELQDTEAGKSAVTNLCVDGAVDNLSADAMKTLLVEYGDMLKEYFGPQYEQRLLRSAARRFDRNDLQEIRRTINPKPSLSDRLVDLARDLSRPILSRLNPE
ncbi:hypothetical protein MRY87_13375 [bacterium]|nr:hypothetical protein [bacterium]